MSRRKGPTPMPALAHVSLTTMRDMRAGESILFAGDGAQPMRSASCNACRLAPKTFQTKTVIVIDPVDATAVRGLFVTRIS